MSQWASLVVFPSMVGMSAGDQADDRAGEPRGLAGLRLALAALVLIGGLGLAFRLSGSSLGVGASYSWFRTTEASYDSWGPMIAAYHHVIDGHPLYDVFFVGHVKYQYPPASLFPIWLLDALGVAGREGQIRVLNVVTWWSVLLTVPFVFGIAWNVGGGRCAAPSRALFAACLAIAATTLCFWPIMISWTLGQIQVVLNLLFVVALYAWTGGWRLTAGVCIGLACAFKPQFLLFLPWGLLADRRLFAGQFAVCALIFGASLAVFGMGTHLAYLKVLSFLSAHGESYVLNQSVNGLVNRIVYPETTWIDRGRVWPDGSDFPPYSRIVHLISSAATLAASAAALWLAWRRGATAVTFSFAALAMTLGSPIAWDHHYGILIGVFAAVFGVLTASAARGRRAGAPEILFLVSGALVGVRLLPHLPGQPLVENLLVSHLFAGATLMLALLWCLRTYGPPPIRTD